MKPLEPIAWRRRAEERKKALELKPQPRMVTVRVEGQLRAVREGSVLALAVLCGHRAAGARPK